MIQALPLKEMEPDQDISEYIEIGDGGRKETDVTVDILCTVEPVIDGDILFNCNFSVAKGAEMDIDDGTYSCFICQDFDPHSFNRASDLIRHSVSKHKQYPDKANITNLTRSTNLTLDQPRLMKFYGVVMDSTARKA